MGSAGASRPCCVAWPTARRSTPSEYYFRVTVHIEATGAYGWLSERILVASAARSAAAVDYDLYAVT